MRRPSDIIPSMFHRRLLLLFFACAAAACILGLQTARLTVVEGPALRAEAEARLVRESWTPTTRGRILDRKGRVLAVDRPGYALSVDFPVLTGEWTRRQAVAQARAENQNFDSLSIEQQEALVRRYEPFFDHVVDNMWREICIACDIDRAELDQRIEAVIARVNRMYAHIVDVRREKAIADATKAGREIDDRTLAEIERNARLEIGEQNSAHELVTDVPDKVGFQFLRLADQTIALPYTPTAGNADSIPRMPGLHVRDATERIYPFDEVAVDVDLSTLPQPIRQDSKMSIDSRGVAWHLLGRMRENATAEDIDARAQQLKRDAKLAKAAITASGTDRGKYFPTDAVGIAGIEGAREAELRGLRGLRTTHLDTGLVDEVPPTPGEDIYLTLDVMLQARVRAAMDPKLGLAEVQPWHGNESMPVGTPLYGAAVVLDIDRAEILAMVSTPHVPRDGLWFDDDDANKRFIAENAPYVNRAIAKPYPPGSIAKALMLCGAVKQGVHDLDKGIVCTGHLFPDKPGVFRCWIYKHYNGLTHSPGGRPVFAPQALEVSCNIYFYTLGLRMGPMGVAEAYHMFGLGTPFNLGVGTEWPGKIGPFNSDIDDGSNLTQQDGILMAIGQGPITWTPLYAADAYATIARAGYRIPPHLIASDAASPQVQDLGLDRRAVEQAMEGLSLSVNDQNGTGNHLTYLTPEGLYKREEIFNVPGVTVWGKTGTASAPDLRVDPDGDGPEPERVVRSGDHSWFVVLVGPEGGTPRFVISCVMDYAGSGGRISGPIVNQIIWALRAEGYI